MYSLPQPFSDPGTNLAYYNYTAQGAVTAITTDTADCTGTSVPSRCGYILNCNGQTGDIASATTSYFTPNQIINVESISSLASAALPRGTTVRIIASCNGTAYSNEVTSNGSFDTSIAMSSIPTVEKCSNVAIGFVLPAAVTNTQYRLVGLFS